MSSRILAAAALVALAGFSGLTSAQAGSAQTHVTRHHRTPVSTRTPGPGYYSPYYAYPGSAYGAYSPYYGFPGDAYGASSYYGFPGYAYGAYGGAAGPGTFSGPYPYWGSTDSPLQLMGAQ
jgi:hypothetical protein